MIVKLNYIECGCFVRIGLQTSLKKIYDITKSDKMSKTTYLQKLSALRNLDLINAPVMLWLDIHPHVQRYFVPATITDLGSSLELIDVSADIANHELIDTKFQMLLVPRLAGELMFIDHMNQKHFLSIEKVKLFNLVAKEWK